MSTDAPSAGGTTYQTERDDDGNIVSSTATTTDDDGNVVSVVERRFDSDGNVVSAKYTDHSVDADTGETTTEVTEYSGGQMVEESSRTTDDAGTLLEESVTTFDDEGHRDQTVSRTYDPGGAPLTTTTTTYDDDGRPMKTEMQTETGATVVSYNGGEHVRTSANDDGTVTRETIRVDDDGTIEHSHVEVTDSSGEIQSSTTTDYDSVGEPVRVVEATYADGHPTSTTTTTSDDEGTYVAEHHLDEQGQPTSEVRTTYDSEGNLTSTTHTEYDASGEVTYQGDEPPRAEFFESIKEHIDLPDLPDTSTSVDASDLLGATDATGAVLASGATTGATIRDDLVGVVSDSGDGGEQSEVLWSTSESFGIGGRRVITGFADGSILISTQGSSTFGLGPRLSWSEHVHPDGTRVVTQPIDESIVRHLGIEIGEMEGFEAYAAGAGSVTIAYAADGSMEYASWFTQGNSGHVQVEADGSLTTTVNTYENGELVDSRVETSPPPSDGGDPFDFSDPFDSTATASVDEALTGVDGPPVVDVSPTVTVHNADGSTVETTTYLAGDIRMEQQITGADGSVRTIIHYSDGSVAFVEADGTTEHIHPDGTVETSGGDSEVWAPDLGFDAGLPDATGDDDGDADDVQGAESGEQTDDQTLDALVEELDTELSDVVSGPGDGAFIKVDEGDVPGDDFEKLEYVADDAGGGGPGDGAFFKLDDLPDEFIKLGDATPEPDDFLKLGDATAEPDDFLKLGDATPEPDDFVKLGDVAAELPDDVGMVEPALASDPAELRVDLDADDPGPEAVGSQPGQPHFAPPQLDDGLSDMQNAESITAIDPAPPSTGALANVGDDAQLATVGEDAQLADPFAPGAGNDDVAEEIKVTYDEPVEAADVAAVDTAAAAPSAAERIEFDDPLAAPDVREVVSPTVETPEVVREVVLPIADSPDVELPAVQKDPVPEPVAEDPSDVAVPQVDVDVQLDRPTDVVDLAAPAFEEPVEHSLSRELLDPDPDLGEPLDGDSFDEGLPG